MNHWLETVSPDESQSYPLKKECPFPPPKRASANLEDWLGYIARGTRGKEQEMGVITYHRNRNHLPPAWVGPVSLLTCQTACQHLCFLPALRGDLCVPHRRPCPQSHLLSLREDSNDLLACPQQKVVKSQGPAMVCFRDQKNRELQRLAWCTCPCGVGSQPRSNNHYREHPRAGVLSIQYPTVQLRPRQLSRI